MPELLMAMSGGVDSSAALLLLKEKYQITGATMLLHTPEDGEGCGSFREAEDAKAVAEKLGLPHVVLDFRKEFRRRVMEPFSRDYFQGETPNPCIECNRYLKFGALLEEAQRRNIPYLATGHYVRKGYDESTGRYYLYKAADESKDQSYVLYHLSQHQLAHAVFPLGDYTKPQIRALAEEAGLITAKKKDSQDICFVPDGDYVGFLRRFWNQTCPPGKFIDRQGKVLGDHPGIIHYTVGQRKGLGVTFGKPMYVLAKDAARHTVTLGENQELFSRRVLVNRLCWMYLPGIQGPVRVNAKLRYNMKEQPCTVIPHGEDRVVLEFDTPQRAAAPGQSAVFYLGNKVAGGGVIVSALPEE